MSTSPPRRRSPRISRSSTSLIAMLLIGALIATALLGAFGVLNGKANASAAAATPVPTTGPGTALDPQALYKSTAAGVVDITAHGTSSNAAAAGPFGGVPPRTPTTDTGTGFILDRAGDVMTAAHVVDGASSIRITLQNGTSYRATLLGEDNSTDVAILKIDSPPATLQPVKLGSSAALSVGAPIAAIGDPYALDRSLSTGIVSGLDRTIQAPSGFTVAHAIQTDAALNPGNSGGPILAANGSVIGIADQIATNGADQNSGVGFAVPIDIARSEMVALEHGQQVKHTYLGIGTETATGSTTGALVGQVVPNGPAATAGIKTGDVITAINSTTITNPNSLVAAISSAKPGDKVTMTVKRGATTKTLTVTLGTQPAQNTTAAG
jgi:putative serine protease PepD